MPQPSQTPSLFWLSEPETRLSTPAQSGADIALAIPYRGLTPYRWVLSGSEGDLRIVETRRRPSMEGGVGAGGYEFVAIRLGSGGSGLLSFVLRDPAGDIADARRAFLNWTAD